MCDRRGPPMEPAPQRYRGPQGEAIGMVRLKANAFRLEAIRNQIFKHRVDFEPADLLRRIRGAAVRANPKLKGHDFVLSGETLLASVQLPDESWTFRPERQTYDVKVTVKSGALVDPRTASLEEVLCVNNIAIRRALSLIPGLKQVGRDYVDWVHNRAITIGRSGMSVGLADACSLATGLYEAGPLLGVDLYCRTISTDSLLQLVFASRGRPSIHEDEILQMTVVTDYNHMLYRITCRTNKRASDTMDTKDGPITFADYVWKRYERKTSDLNQPMIEAYYRPRAPGGGRREKRTVLLIPEFCRLVGLTKRQKADRSVRDGMVAATKLTPQGREDKLREFIGRVRDAVPATCPNGHRLRLVGTHDPQLPCACGAPGVYMCDKRKPCGAYLCTACAKRSVRFNPSIAEYPIEVPGRQLGECDIMSAGKSFPTRNGNWDSWSHTATVGSGTVQRVAYLYPADAEPIAEQFYTLLHQIGAGDGRRLKGMGIVLPPKPPVIFPYASNPRDTSVQLREIERFKAELGEKVKEAECVIVVLRDNSPVIYDAFKKLFINDLHVVSQCVTLGKAENALRQLAIGTKIYVQLCTKIGAVPWEIALNAPPYTMLVGIDVVRTKESWIVSMVSTTDSSYGHYHSQSRLCDNGVDCLGAFMQAAVDAFKQRSSALPQYVIVYRNGVSDAQIRNVIGGPHGSAREGEVTELQQMKSVFPPEGGPQMVVVLAIRRGMTRFFTEMRIPPGTVIDRAVVAHQDDREHQGQSDFFLVSQPVREGSVRPTHYRVLVNEANVPPAAVQQITHQLCHMYFNWTGTIAVPAPIMFAQKLCEFVDQHIKPERTYTIASAFASSPPYGMTESAKKKREYTCSLCGPFSRHTKRGHQSATNTMFALQADELRMWVLNNVIDRMNKSDAVRVALLGPPTSDTSTDHLINCPGRNYFALLLHRRDVVNRCKLSPSHVFSWARMLSDGTHTDTENPPGAVVASAASEVAAATSGFAVASSASASSAVARQAMAAVQQQHHAAQQSVMAPSSSDPDSSSSSSPSSSRSSSPSPRSSPMRGKRPPLVHDVNALQTPAKRGRRASSSMGLAMSTEAMLAAQQPATCGRVRVVPILLQVPPDAIPAVLRFVADIVAKEEGMVDIHEAATLAAAEQQQQQAQAQAQQDAHVQQQQQQMAGQQVQQVPMMQMQQQAQQQQQHAEDDVQVKMETHAPNVPMPIIE
eukprot:m51a1_g8106 putative piwi-like protein 1-like (1210) ;mRNA; r:102359-107663